MSAADKRCAEATRSKGREGGKEGRKKKLDMNLDAEGEDVS